MDAHDVPYITTSVWNAVEWTSEDQDLRVPGSGRTPETLYRRLAALSEADLDRHLAIIEEAVRRRFGLEATQEPE
jgi:hypothetical protein